MTIERFTTSDFNCFSLSPPSLIEAARHGLALRDDGSPRFGETLLKTSRAVEISHHLSEIFFGQAGQGLRLA
jgi:hypothetical protein